MVLSCKYCRQNAEGERGPDLEFRAKSLSGSTAEVTALIG